MKQRIVYRCLVIAIGCLLASGCQGKGKPTTPSGVVAAPPRQLIEESYRKAHVAPPGPQPGATAPKK